MHKNTVIILTIKKILFLINLILLSSFVIASSRDVVTDIGVITLKIINRPPEITKIYFDSDIVFEDSKLECIAIVNDEKPDEIKLLYKWHINSELIETNNNFLIGFDEGDLIKCEVIPIDNENVFGKAKSASVTISKKSTLNAITGFIVKNYKNNFSLSEFFNVFNLLF